MDIEVAYALPDRQFLIRFKALDGCTVEQAIEQSGVREAFPGIRIDPAAVGVFSRKVTMDHVLRQGDRVEIYRALIADPKEMRKQRAARDASAG